MVAICSCWLGLSAPKCCKGTDKMSFGLCKASVNTWEWLSLNSFIVLSFKKVKGPPMILHIDDEKNSNKERARKQLYDMDKPHSHGKPKVL